MFKTVKLQQTIQKQFNTETNKVEYSIQTTGYLVDDMFVPLDPANRHYQEIQEWIKQGNKPEPQYTEEDLLNYVKNEKLTEIKNAFLNAGNGYMYSETLKTNVNVGDVAFRNVQSLIDYMTENNITNTQFRVYDNSFVEITLDQLKQLKNEMIQYGLNLYHKKWDLESQIKNATTIDEVLQIKW